MTELSPEPVVAAEDTLRADLYDFLAAMLASPPSGDLLSRAASLTGDDSPLGHAIDILGRVARTAKPASAEREFNALFIGLGRGELLPYASFYMTGFLNEKPLSLLRADMARLGIARAENVFEPEDNIASLCEMMSGMILGRFGQPADLLAQQAFFRSHIGPWAAHFFKDLEGARNSVLYAPIGAIGQQFMEIEAQAFRMVGTHRH